MMNYTIVGEASELAEWSKESEALSVYEALSTLEDRRGRKGKRYSLALVITCVLLGKLAGETTLLAIADWIRLRQDWLHTVLPTTPKSISLRSDLQQCLTQCGPSPGQSTVDGSAHTGQG